MFAITLDDLRSHAFTVSKCTWDKLLRNRDALLIIESAIADAMYIAAAPCTVTLTPQSEKRDNPS